MTIAKAIVAAIGSIATILDAAFADNVVTMTENEQIISIVAIQAITVYGVWKTRNKDKTKVE